jgi:Zn finger protein HypA/HybF involved in hydrogenase expression
MCFKAAPGTIYQKCGDRVEGIEKVYKCANYPNGPDCANLKFNNSITDKKQVGYCPECVAKGKS